jgi:site-specific DNA-methyltransferase (adenine-specific)
MKLYNGECLEVMDLLIEQGVKVDSIICDPPYGTTACKWDSVIPFDEMWLRLNKLIKPNGAIVLFGSEPFSSALRMSNIKNYKYDWIWNKVKPSGHLNAKNRPMTLIENVVIFNVKKDNYYPIMTDQKPRKSESPKKHSEVYGKQRAVSKIIDKKHPKQIIEISNANQKGKVHPTQKPVELMEYLIKTYTNENEIVLDFTMGSGSTGVACKNTGRDFIGIELDKGYYDIACNRIKEAKNEA